MKNPNENGFVGHDKPVKSIIKSATNIIAAADRFLTFDVVMLMLAFDVGFIGYLMLNGGI